MIEIGDKIEFIPSGYFDNPERLSVSAPSVPTVEGTVIYINEAHRYYRVEYRTEAGCIGHECFKY